MTQNRRWIPLFALFLAALFLGACAATQVPTTKDEVPRMTVEELKERMDNGEAILIGDTRSKIEYDIRHIPGAISIPERQVEAQLNEIPQDQEIILYCT